MVWSTEYLFGLLNICELEMKVKNKLKPNAMAMAGFLIGDTKSSIRMVNLLKFRKKASYEDGRETDLTGEEAYKI